MLRELRTRQHLSLRKLEASSGVDFSRVGLMEHGDLACGPERAVRLANALGLTGKERELFLCTAAGTSSENPLAADYGGLPFELFRWLGYVLVGHQVTANRITNVEVDPVKRVNGNKCDVLIRKRNGDVLGIEFKIHARIARRK